MITINYQPNCFLIAHKLLCALIYFLLLILPYFIFFCLDCLLILIYRSHCQWISQLRMMTDCVITESLLIWVSFFIRDVLVTYCCQDFETFGDKILCAIFGHYQLTLPIVEDGDFQEFSRELLSTPDTC